MVSRRRHFRATHQDLSINHISGNKYIVNGSRSIDYEVKTQPIFCTCPDWEERSPEGGCKHVLAVKIHTDELDPLTITTPSGSASKNRTGIDPDLREQVLEQDENKCQRCGKTVGGKHDATSHVHHIIPKSKGGSDDLTNLITLCHPCHEDIHGYSIPSGTNISGQGTSSNRKKGSDDPQSTVIKNGPDAGPPSESKESEPVSWSSNKRTDQSSEPVQPTTARTDPDQNYPAKNHESEPISSAEENRHNSTIKPPNVDQSFKHRHSLLEFDQRAVPHWSESHPEDYSINKKGSSKTLPPDSAGKASNNTQPSAEPESTNNDDLVNELADDVEVVTAETDGVQGDGSDQAYTQASVEEQNQSWFLTVLAYLILLSGVIYYLFLL